MNGGCDRNVKHSHLSSGRPRPPPWAALGMPLSETVSPLIPVIGEWRMIALPRPGRSDRAISGVGTVRTYVTSVRLGLKLRETNEPLGARITARPTPGDEPSPLTQITIVYLRDTRALIVLLPTIIPPAGVFETAIRRTGKVSKKTAAHYDNNLPNAKIFITRRIRERAPRELPSETERERSARLNNI